MIAGSLRYLVIGIGAAGLLVIACHANDQPTIPTYLGFEAQPIASVLPADPLGTVTVELLTADHQRAVASTVTVQLSLLGANGNAHLLGALSSNAVAGVATFSGLSVDSAGSAYRLVAKASGLDSAMSQPFTVRRLGRLRFDQITFTRAHELMAPVAVNVVDDAGNLLPTATPPITISSAGPVLSGTTTVTAVNGTAIFSNLSLGSWGYDRLVATAPNFAPDTSSGFVEPAPCTHLVLSGVSDGKAGVPLPSFMVSPRDQYGGNCVALPPGGVMRVTVALGNNQSGAKLSGDTIVAGLRVGTMLSNVVIDRAGTGYTLIVSTPGLASATSNPFSVVP